MKRNHPSHRVNAAGRRAVAQRRVGLNARCHSCGETRPEALIRRSKPMRCAECQRKAEGQSAVDQHHVAGRNNSPVTIPIPVNDHRAELSVAQMDWSRNVRENPTGDPLIAAAAMLRGTADVVMYLFDKFVDTAIALLELLADYLTRTRGPQWWRGTPIDRFSPQT
jgi:hypothetical protein